MMVFTEKLLVQVLNISGPKMSRTRFLYIKTHKLEPKDLQAARVENIPGRLLQSAGSITTFRVTAFLEHLFKAYQRALLCPASGILPRH